MQMSVVMMGSRSVFSGDVETGGSSSVVETRSPRRGGVGEVPLPTFSVLIFPAVRKMTQRSDTSDYHLQAGQPPPSVQPDGFLACFDVQGPPHQPCFLCHRVIGAYLFCQQAKHRDGIDTCKVLP